LPKKKLKKSQKFKKISKNIDNPRIPNEFKNKNKKKQEKTEQIPQKNKQKVKYSKNKRKN
jgi:hypothetical protein